MSRMNQKLLLLLFYQKTLVQLLFCLLIYVVTCTFIPLFIGELKASDDGSNCGNQTIIITVLSVLLAVAVVCIAGLVIRNVQLNKKHAQNKSKEK